MANITVWQNSRSIVNALAEGVAAADWFSDPDQPYFETTENGERHTQIQEAVKERLLPGLKEDETLIGRISSIAIKVSEAVSDGRPSMVIDQHEFRPADLSRSLYLFRAAREQLYDGDVVGMLVLPDDQLANLIRSDHTPAEAA